MRYTMEASMTEGMVFVQVFREDGSLLRGRTDTREHIEGFLAGIQRTGDDSRKN